VRGLRTNRSSLAEGRHSYELVLDTKVDLDLAPVRGSGRGSPNLQSSFGFCVPGKCMHGAGMPLFSNHLLTFDSLCLARHLNFALLSVLCVFRCLCIPNFGHQQSQPTSPSAHVSRRLAHSDQAANRADQPIPPLQSRIYRASRLLHPPARRPRRQLFRRASPCSQQLHSKSEFTELMYTMQHTMSSPWKQQPEAVADKVLKRAELSKV
jgi:hypothetical protein